MAAERPDVFHIIVKAYHEMRKCEFWSMFHGRNSLAFCLQGPLFPKGAVKPIPNASLTVERSIEKYPTQKNFPRPSNSARGIAGGIDPGYNQRLRVSGLFVRNESPQLWRTFVSTQTVAETTRKPNSYEDVIADICNLSWTNLVQDELMSVAWAYYYFSVQFRECLEIALRLYPHDEQLQHLDAGERNTDNLSPWPGVAGVGEKMNHDEFMRRTLELTKISDDRRRVLTKIGLCYLHKAWQLDDKTRAMALASYEDGGLERVFSAILTARNWDGPLLKAFQHFLAEHIRFDSDPEQGHGALCRHLTPDEHVYPLWVEFKRLLVRAAPRLAQ